MASCKTGTGDFCIRPRGIERCWLWLLCSCLLGYALFGKGFAYLGVAPFYVSEAVLIPGGLILLAKSRDFIRSMGRSFAVVMLCVFMGYGAFRTAPYWGEYGLNALRDAVIWGYALFALTLFVLAARNGMLVAWLVRRYRGFARVYPPVAALVLVVQTLRIPVPNLPGTQVPLLSLKPGDAMVHMAGVSVFVLGGLGTVRGIAWLLNLFVAVMICATGNRGAALSYVIAIAITMCFSRRARVFAPRLLLPVTVLITAGFFITPEVKLHQDREISLRQLALNYASVVMSLEDNPGNAEASKQWRLHWWNKIVDYTFYGDYFWEGKGFGLNLAISDGVGSVSGTLRSPHNIHMTVLARGGVIGICVWVIFLVAWVVAVVKSLLRARFRNDHEWEALFAFLAAYWCACLVNASFDVYLEGPMGGIWFWDISGIGLAAARYYQDCTAPAKSWTPSM